MTMKNQTSRRDFIKKSSLLAVGASLGESVFPASGNVLYSDATEEEIIIENTEICLILSTDGKALSLIHKSSGEECLVKNVKSPVFALTEYCPYDSENFLTYIARATTYPANKVVREGDKLNVNFERIAYTATILLNITPEYIGLKLTELDYDLEKVSSVKRRTEIDEFTLLQ